MTVRNVTQAKAELSALLALVEGGEEVVISRAGKPIAKLIRIQPGFEPRQPGSMKGQIKMASDFDELGERLGRDFFGEEKL